VFDQTVTLAFGLSHLTPSILYFFGILLHAGQSTYPWNIGCPKANGPPSEIWYPEYGLVSFSQSFKKFPNHIIPKTIGDYWEWYYDENLPLNCNLLQLAQIPGMSLQNAQIIIDKYGSIANLIKSYYDINDMDEDKRIKMLIDLEISISNGKKRKLGKVLSERIYQYFFNKN
jgi:hypothetical protein